MSEITDRRLFAEDVPGDANTAALEQEATDLQEKVERFINENGLLPARESVLIGLSGGADSVALMKLLTRLAPKYGWNIRAAHFNHGIRGVGAEEDELFCRNLCEEMGVNFYSETADVPTYARENGLSIETAGRMLRYEFLERTAKKTGCGVISTAHHMDDNAESIMLHLIRGSGLSGLTGMKPKRDMLIRPLLSCRKEELEAFLETEGILYRTDETNLIPEGSRNRVRLDIVPYLEKHINPAIVPTLCGMADLLAQDEAYLSTEAEKALEQTRSGDGFLREKIAALPYPIKTRVIRMALAEAGALVDIERVHVEAVIELLEARTGAMLTLPKVEAWTSYDLIKFGRITRAEAFTIPLKPGLISTPLGLFKVDITNGTEGFTKDPGVAFLDMDKVDAMEYPPVIRTRLDGDRFHPVGAPGKKKLKDYLIDRKVDRTKRDEIPLIACGSEVLFVTGYAASESTKVDENTARMLRAQFLGQAEKE
ncbi:MAG: tRNA lysidine(34) synthetase TilS [Clostridia bacterium]|nr:tRNA lysidine(34) synthetase TilS [Clostridia bacterium]